MSEIIYFATVAKWKDFTHRKKQKEFKHSQEQGMLCK